MVVYLNEKTWRKLHNSIRAQRTELKKYIHPFKEYCKSEKESIELHQTAKMLWLLNDGIEIVKKNESPDFIISYNGELIGLEHQTIKNLAYTAFEGSKRELVNQSIEIFNERFNSYKHFESKYPECPFMLISIEFCKDFNFTKTQKNELKEEIVTYIWNESQLIETKKPDFINRIRISPPHTKLFLL